MLASVTLALTLGVMSSDIYVSLPATKEIRRLDPATGTLHPFATGIFSAFYGEFGSDGCLYVQDSQLAAVWKVAPDGTKTMLSSGGMIGTPLSVALHPTTGELYVTDALYQHVIKVDPVSGAQTLFADNSLGQFVIPGGLSFDNQGNLWMTDHGNYKIFQFDASGNATEFFDGQSIGLLIPAGIEADTAGNLFVAGFGSDWIARIRTDTGEWEVFSDDPILQEPNDLMISPDGGLICACSGTSAIVRLDALGNITVLGQDPTYGGFLGVAIPGAYPGCSGSITSVGTGTPGTGGSVPRMQGIYCPAPGSELGYVIDNAVGGASGFYLYSFGQGPGLPAWGGTLWIDFGSVLWGLIPFQTTGTGPGNGEKRFSFLHPDDPTLVGINFTVQSVILDPGNPSNRAMSNALSVDFGSF